jgi:hypothetical protein
MIQHGKKPTWHDDGNADELDEHTIEKVAGGRLTSGESSSTSHASKKGTVEYTWKIEKGEK